ncbi:hypothetical protein L6164_003230 [Bauhinia variegata]|uniref:Uncharacterized protein n=1 Tax=Bauhinia variegata TaxID=167791 RepID=A0ACB9Q192_BAUVA|nr:hypothetical protein L6164_003230 [Bauhinia variegata]
MLEFFSEIATKTIECIFAFIWKHLCYVLFYKKNVNNLKDQVKDLEGQRERIQHWVDAETRNGKTIFDDVPKWLGEVEMVTQETEQLQGNADHASVGCCPNLRLRHQLGRKAEFEAKNVVDLKIKGEQFTNVAYDPPSEPDFTTYTRGIQNFESRNSIMNDIMHAVTTPDVSMVGVYGLGGVGKTTLMYQVAEKAKLDKCFDAVVWASVTQAPDIISIQGEIADQLDLKLEKETSFGRALCLRKRIKNEKTVLIILDDIWKRFDMNEVGIPLGDHRGCKVLMTSRSQDVLQEMECQRDFRLEPLDESETWRLFQVMAGDVIEDIAIQVANQCKGLPVLILAVSRALKGKGIHAWKDALHRLRRVDNEDLRDIYHSALELSYNGLDGNDVKKLFLLCGVLGPSAPISALLKYGIGLGIFKDVNTVENAGNRLHSMIDKLMASCLLLEDGKSSRLIKMHDNVCEVAVSIALKDERVFAIRCSELTEWPSERYTMIILRLCRIHKLPNELDNPELKLLYLNNGSNHFLKIPNSFFEGLTNLEVLDLTCMNIPSLPLSMSSLTKLKTLLMDRCTLGDMVALAALKNIEILSLWKSSITKLPTEIGQLTRLRMLDLNSSGIDLIPPNIISRLIKLEKFYAGDTSINWEAENAEQNKNATVTELSQLPHLTALNIQIQDASILPRDDSFFERGLSQLQEIEVSECNLMKDIVFSDDNEMVAFHNLKILKLSSINSKKIWDDSQFLTTCCVQNLTSLIVVGCGNMKYLFLPSMVGSFSKLKLLEIINCRMMEDIVAADEERNNVGVNIAEVQFPKLEKMIINDMENLKAIWHQQFASLRAVEVKNCEKLVRIFPSHMQRKFSSLETIKVTDCSSLKEIFELNANENERESEAETQLRRLTLLQLPNLKQIWSGEVQGILKFQNLEAVCVQGCPKLDYLLPLSIATCLPQLEEIIIRKTPSMKEFVAKIEEYMEGTVNFKFDRLSRFSIWNLLEADRFYAGNFTLHCPSLKILDVFNCPKLELFKTQSTSYPERDHGNLNVSTPQPFFIVEEVIPKLEELTLTGKDALMIQQGQFSVDLNSKLTVLRLLYFRDERTTFPLWILQKLPKLRELYIQFCSFKEILHEGETGQIQITTQLKLFHLVEVHEIQHLCKDGSQLDPVLEVVEDIMLDRCSGLKYLVPSYVTFSYLTKLLVWECNRLMYLFSSSTARSLVKLRRLYIWECESLQEIVKEKEDEILEQDIAFNSLIILELKCLPNLNWFSSSKCALWFPTLYKVVVEKCPKMTTFSVGDTSTPDLRKVEANGRSFWEGNLNATITKMSTYCT